jgi:hypothetical protein
VVYFLLQIVFSLESSFRCTSPILGEIGGNLTDKYLLQMSDLGHPVRMKFIPSLAFSVTRHRSTTERPLKAPGRNWAKALEKRHLELGARRVKALD